MADRHSMDAPAEAEPVVLDVQGRTLTVILDDGERLVFDLHEFETELDLMKRAAASERRAA